MRIDTYKTFSNSNNIQEFYNEVRTLTNYIAILNLVSKYNITQTNIEFLLETFDDSMFNSSLKKHLITIYRSTGGKKLFF